MKPRRGFSTSVLFIMARICTHNYAQHIKHSHLELLQPARPVPLRPEIVPVRLPCADFEHRVNFLPRGCGGLEIMWSGSKSSWPCLQAADDEDDSYKW